MKEFYSNRISFINSLLFFYFSVKKVRSSRSFNNGTTSNGNILLTGCLPDEESST